MENKLIQLYLLVCCFYDTNNELLFQRQSNNQLKPTFTDAEVMTLYLFGHFNRHYQKRAIYEFISEYWREWFPALPSYQAFNRRLNQLEPDFQAFLRQLFLLLDKAAASQTDWLCDSLPIICAAGTRSTKAKVAREIAQKGWCAAKKLYFHGVRLHCAARRRSGQLPVPRLCWLREASCHDLTSLRSQELEAFADSTIFGDKAYPDPQLSALLTQFAATILTPMKKPKGKQLSDEQKYFNKLVSSLRQPIESLFKWLIDKTDIQRASSVRSTEGLLLHCAGKLTVALILLVFYC